MLKSLLPDDVTVIITIDDIRPKSNLTTDKTIRFTKKSFFYIILGFTQSPSGSIADIEGFVHLIPDIYKSEKPINNTSVDKIEYKFQKLIVFTEALAIEYEKLFCRVLLYLLHQVIEIMVNQESNFSKEYKFVLSHITFYLEDDDHRSVDFNGGTINFTRQLIKIYSLIFDIVYLYLFKYE